MARIFDQLSLLGWVMEMNGSGTAEMEAGRQLALAIRLMQMIWQIDLRASRGRLK